MRTAYRLPVAGIGTADYLRTRTADRHQPGDIAQEHKAPAATRHSNGFLTERLLPVAPDYCMDEDDVTCINLTTPESFDYLYRSAVNYARLLDVRLPFPKKSRSRCPRLDIARLLR